MIANVVVGIDQEKVKYSSVYSYRLVIEDIKSKDNSIHHNRAKDVINVNN